MSVPTIAEALANVALTEDIEDGDLVADAVVALRLVNADTGRESVLLATNESISIITQLGLIEAARQITSGDGWITEDEDE